MDIASLASQLALESSDLHFLRLELQAYPLGIEWVLWIQTPVAMLAQQALNYWPSPSPCFALPIIRPPLSPCQAALTRTITAEIFFKQLSPRKKWFAPSELL